MTAHAKPGKPIYVAWYLSAKVWGEKDGIFYAECSSLDITAMGESREEATKQLSKLTHDFFVVHIEDNVLWDVLKDCHVELTRSEKDDREIVFVTPSKVVPEPSDISGIPKESIEVKDLALVGAHS